MSIVINARATNVASFQIGKRGPTIYQGTELPTITSPSPVIDGDMYIRNGSTPNIYQLVNGVWWQYRNDVVQSLPYAPSLSIDWDLGDYAIVTLAGDAAIDMAGSRSHVLLVLKQDAIGSRAVTWGANIRFSTDIPGVSLSTTPLAEDKIGFMQDPISGKYDCIQYVRGF